MQQNQNKITAIVVGFNESVKLKHCLSSLSFCEEIIYIDLGSIDNSIEIAKYFSARIIFAERELIVEKILSKYFKNSKNDLVLLLDPDEYIPSNLADQIIYCTSTFDLNTFGGLILPQAFYFKGKRLKGTVWSTFRSKLRIFNKNKVSFDALIHSGLKLSENCSVYEIELDENKLNEISHYWVDGYRNLIIKHLRYLKFEVESIKSQNKPIKKTRFVFEFFQQFYKSYFINNGYLDSLAGLLLSLFWGVYKHFILLIYFVKK